MCGITGWVDFRRDLRPERPDDRGDDLDDGKPGSGRRRGMVLRPRGHRPPKAVGHRPRRRRAANAGGPPRLRRRPRPRPRTEDEVVLTFSGEVYNFTELRSELTSLGHQFRTRSDTEVVLHAYLQWGADCVTRLNGMFAFAIWDGRRQELLLARDRLGVKPLYYAKLPDGVLFGSEPKAILAHPGFRAEIDAEGLAELFAQAGTGTPGHGVYRGPVPGKARHDRPGRPLRPKDVHVLDARGARAHRRPRGHGRERPRAPGRHRAPPDRRRRAAVQPAVRRPRLERRLRAGGATA